MNQNKVLYDYAGREITDLQKKSVGSDIEREFYRWGYSNSGAITAQDVESYPYKYHSLIFACCNFILRNVSRLPWYIYDINVPEKHIFDDPVLDLLQKPHPLLTKTAFLQAIILSILLPSGGIGKNSKGGQCFILCHDNKDEPCDLSRGNIPTLLLPMNDNYITANTVKGQNGLNAVIGWKFKIPSQPSSEKIYGLKEIIRINQFNPYNWVEGVSNYQPAMTAIMLDLKSDLYNDGLFTNLAVPTGVLSTEQPMVPDQRREELRHWNETMGGTGNSQRTAILSKGLKYQHIGLTNVDMQYTQLKEFTQRCEIAPFGLNKIAVGNYESINYATIVEGRKMLWHDVNLPMIDLICEAFNFSWIINIDKGKRIGLDISKVEYLEPDYSKKAISAGILIEKCLLTPELALRKAGIPLTDEEIKKAPWLTENPLKTRSEFVPSFPAAETVKSFRSDIRIYQDEKEKWWYGYVERILNPNEKKYIRSLHTFFNSQRNDFQDKVDEWLSRQKKAVIISLDDLLIDKNKQDEKLINLSKPIHKDQLLRTEEQLKVELGQLIAWSVADDTIDKSIARRSRFLKGLNKTTFRTVEKEALDLFNTANIDNWTTGELAKALKISFSEIYETRKSQAMTIARTEIGSVTEDARYVAFVMEDIEYHEWLNAADEKVREHHKPKSEGGVGGEIVKVGSYFPIVRMRYPLDNEGQPQEVINCRCVNIVAERP